MGYAFIKCAVYTYEYAKYSNDQFSQYDDYPDYIGLMFAGSFISCFFWVKKNASTIEHNRYRERVAKDSPCSDNTSIRLYIYSLESLYVVITQVLYRLYII